MKNDSFNPPIDIPISSPIFLIPLSPPIDISTPFYDPCSIFSFTSCEECFTNNLCGWCDDNSLCLSGDDSGPSSLTGETCQDWIFLKCPTNTTSPETVISPFISPISITPSILNSPTSQITCESLLTCTTCSETTGCGWCSNTKECLDGDYSGPTNSSLCLSQNWQFYSYYCKKKIIYIWILIEILLIN